MNAKLKTRNFRARRNTMARAIRIHGIAYTIRTPHLYLKTIHSSTARYICDDDSLLIAYRREGCVIFSTAQDGGL